MRVAISNSSPLIFLAKINALEILDFFYDKIYIPSVVYHEVVEEGMENIHPDAILIKNLVDEHKIIVKSDFQHILQAQGYANNALHPGELEALELALTLQGDVILLDDEEARKIGRAFNLRVKGTIGLLMDYNGAGKIDKVEALRLLDELNKLMYLSGDLYRFIEGNLK